MPILGLKNTVHSSIKILKSSTFDSYPYCQVPSGAFTYFVSQNWEREDHPDNDEGTKLAWLKNCKRHLHIHGDREIWVWFDIFSIPQKNREDQKKAISSLPHYTQLCSRILPLVRDARLWYFLYDKNPSELGPGVVRGDINTYYQRGWCRPETNIDTHTFEYKCCCQKAPCDPPKPVSGVALSSSALSAPKNSRISLGAPAHSVCA